MATRNWGKGAKTCRWVGGSRDEVVGYMYMVLLLHGCSFHWAGSWEWDRSTMYPCTV